MSKVIDQLERAQLRTIPSFQAGDRLRVHFQVIEGTRRRTQVFEGIVIKRQGSGVRETFTVRKQSFGVGVERTFPVHSPKIEKIEVAARGDVRRAKLYYLRGRIGKRARVRERRYSAEDAQPQATASVPVEGADESQEAVEARAVSADATEISSSEGSGGSGSDTKDLNTETAKVEGSSEEQPSAVADSSDQADQPQESAPSDKA